jgi:hypothetical protein
MLNPERPTPEHRSNSNGFTRKQLLPVRIVIRDQNSAGQGRFSDGVRVDVLFGARRANRGWLGLIRHGCSLRVYETRFKTGTQLVRMPVRS